MRYFLIACLLVLQPGLSVNSFAKGKGESNFTLAGSLVDEQGTPVAGAKVSTSDAAGVTDADGTFILKAVAAETYQLKFSHPDYFPVIQSFSHYELEQNAASLLNGISLVPRMKSRVMLAFGGDVMMGRRYYKPYFGDQVLIRPAFKQSDSRDIVEHIKPYMSLADYAAVNLETQVADKTPGERAPKSVTFYSHPEVLDALSWAGIDYVSLGNNHTYDYKESGLSSTLAFLEKSELGYSGAGANEQAALKAHRQQIKGNDFSMLGYVGWEGSANPTQTASHDHGGAAYGSMANMLGSVAAEVEKNRIAIVQYHGSLEYADGPTGVTEQRLKSSLDAGAALAIAHHPHVSQGLELYNNKLIAYSMGNFIFDQNFSATQHSFLLYVWLDNGKFHRAEIVPIYVKGYKPTPATGMQRYTVMKRLRQLSKIRDTFIGQSGGHGVIAAANISKDAMLKGENKKRKPQQALMFEQGARVASLYHLPWQQQLTAINLPDKAAAYRLGTNLINGSDFESFATFNSPERGWLFERDTTQVNDFGVSGSKSLSLALTKKKPSVFGMQSFRRVYNASSAMTVTAKFKTSSAVRVNFYWQGRKRSQKLFDALSHGKKQLIGTVELTGGPGWQHGELEFNSPRVGYRSYRVLAELVLENGDKARVDIDDFALIEWQSAYSQTPRPNFYNIDSRQASYLGVDRFVEQAVLLTFDSL
ncbi:CapA family protein [Thalassomonas haliotis]|uniref:CapA family protein n=1 Tax=Thalassomonas haliotis TaxID=485448 RepID=A0ABY7V8B0_9GAMM|nr:CapA family protein [Thalassomonas haliotis]WDE09570.1 CapA family protein [Thalassomonas haliotis]